MVAWIPPEITSDDAQTEAMFGSLQRSMEAMAAVGSDTLMTFPPLRQKPS